MKVKNFCLRVGVASVLAAILVSMSPSRKVEASWQPYVFVTPLVAVGGNTAATTLFTAPTTNYYVVCTYMSPASAVVASSATLSINFTEGGVARTLTTTSLSLASVSGVQSNYILIRADAGTSIQYAVATVGTATYNLHLGWKPQGS